jgi:hypothetical protein
MVIAHGSGRISAWPRIFSDLSRKQIRPDYNVIHDVLGPATECQAGVLDPTASAGSDFPGTLERGSVLSGHR